MANNVRRLLTASLCSLPAARATRYLVVRHGQTNHNAAGILQGSSDVSRLTEKGEEQARQLGLALKVTPDLTRIDRVFVSSLSRAQQTLDSLAASSELPMPDPVVLSDLREIDLGSWEGRNKADVMGEQPGTYAAWKDLPLAFEIDDGFKPIVSLWNRARVAWGAMRTDGVPEAGGLTLVVCHNGIGQALLCTALGLDETHFRRFDFPNCGAAEMSFDEEGATEPVQWRWRLPPDVADGVWRTGPVEKPYKNEV